MKTVKTIILLFLFFTSTNLFSQTCYKLKLKFQVIVKDGNSDNSLITITKNGVSDNVINSDGTKNFLTLDLNTIYLFKCSKEGYTTKFILFDTNVPTGREKEEFAIFTSKLEIHKKVNVNEIDSEKPIGTIKYSPSWKDFEYRPSKH